MLKQRLVARHRRRLVGLVGTGEGERSPQEVGDCEKYWGGQASQYRRPTYKQGQVSKHRGATSHVRPTPRGGEGGGMKFWPLGTIRVMGRWEPSGSGPVGATGVNGWWG